MRRLAHRATIAALGLGMLVSVFPVRATRSAASIASSETEISALSTRLARLSQTGEITANAFDNATVALAGIDRRIARLGTQLASTRAAVTTAANDLRAAVIRYYVAGPVTVHVPAFAAEPTQNAARSIYERLAISRMNDLRDALDRERRSLASTLGEVERQRARAHAQTVQIHALLAENIANTAQTKATLATISHSLATQIISYEIARGVAAAKHHDTSGEVRAITAASSIGGQAAGNQVTAAIEAAAATVTVATTPVAPSARGLAAVHFAETQIGVPYVWGGETPGVGFDCSGLVQWAWGRAGVSIPRTTETQWPALAHVPLTALAPGDLLYYYNLDGDHLVDHMVMYVGSGPYGVNTVIAAAHTGTTVSYAPLFTAGLIGAARP